MEIKKAKDFLTKEEISRLKFIIFLIGICVFIFMDTNLFRNLSDMTKIIIYAVLWGTFIFLKIDILPTKEIGHQIKEIYMDRSMTWFQKGQEFGNIGMDLLHKAGEMWQIGNKEQFEKASTKTETEALLEGLKELNGGITEQQPEIKKQIAHLEEEIKKIG